MKNFGKLALLGAALAVSATYAHATAVTYSTSGAFSGGSGTITNGANSATDVFGSSGNTATLTFTDIPSTPVNAPTNASFGNMNVAVAGTGASGSGTFDLTINETVPTGGSNDFVGTLAGSFTINSSSGTITFSTMSLTIGSGASAITYALQPGGVYDLVPPNDNSGNTSIQGTITPTPEPSSLMLLGTGLLSAGGMLMRRRRMAA